ncbi:MFS transporter, partial [Francisella tularensis subsp. holarctica]|nr:MFS transporter [Francisella tularensis subsp. holarctica]
VRDYNTDASYSKKTKGNTGTLAGIKKFILNKNNLYLTLYTGLTFTTIEVFCVILGNNYFIELFRIQAKDASYIVSMMFL